MEPISRLYYCALCHVQCTICSSCDHGQIYCGLDCAHSARQKSCKEAEQRYQQTHKGKMNHALRQRRYLARLKIKVTDQGYQSTPQDDLLASVEKETIKAVIKHIKEPFECCCCHKPVSSWVRYDFLQQTARSNSPVSLHCDRPP